MDLFLYQILPCFTFILEVNSSTRYLRFSNLRFLRNTTKRF